jgi:small subunit ribosomal protein S17
MARAQAPKGGPPVADDRGPRRMVVGTVVSDRMHKTIVVAEHRLVRHARYGKILKREVTYKAHDEAGEARLGDEVEIAAARRLSKTKHWRLVRVVRRGKAEAVRGEDDREKVAVRTVRPPAAKAKGGEEAAS